MSWIIVIKMRRLRLYSLLKSNF